LVRSMCGAYSAEITEPNDFTGWVSGRAVFGLAAMDLRCNASRVVRTQQDVRLDGQDHYYAVFQVSGESVLVHNDQTVVLSVGDAALVDSARPVTYLSEHAFGHLALKLPRRSLVSHLGYNPQGGISSRGGSAAGRLLTDLIVDADTGGESPSSTQFYMQLAIYDLIGALFVPSERLPLSSSADKLFKRVCCILKAHLADPAFGPHEAAIEAGISVRYLQKLFTARSTTCSHFLYSLRLDHAAQLLARRKLLGTHQPLSEIAYASGFSDYNHFARKFHRRFGHTPGTHTADHN
jgi:AraC family transcriptional activator of tynA and feaB